MANNPIQDNQSRSTNITYSKIINLGVCVDNNDPQRAARIRVIDIKGQGLTQPRINDPVEAIKRFDKEARENKTYKPWLDADPQKGRDRDPFLVSPFLPLHINVIPRIGEAVKVISYETTKDTANREYVGPIISQFGEIMGDNFSNSQIRTSFGAQNAEPPAYAPEGIPIPEGKGSFPNPEDIALVGRDNCDIIMGMREKSIQDETEEEPENWYPQILIRSGKLIKNKEFSSRPKTNKRQTFLQLNTFSQTLTAEEIDVEREITEDAPLATLIEWSLDMSALAVNQLSGTIDFLKMPYKNTNTSKVYLASEFNVETVIPLSGLITQTNRVCRLTFNNVPSIDELSKLINNFIKKIDDSNWVDLKAMEGSYGNPVTGTYTLDYNPNLNPDKVGEFLAGMLHPLYFRPSITTHQLIAKPEPVGAPATYPAMNQLSNDLNELINLDGVKTKGWGLAFTTNAGKRMPETETKKEKEIVLKTEPVQQGIITAGGEKIYLFSYNSTELGQISLDGNYGISQEKFALDLEKRTNSLVRGEKLIELLKEIVNFINNHVHDLPGKPPVEWPIPKADLKSMVENADKIILNKNIRIN